MPRIEPFFDPSDLTACVPATETWAQFHARAREQGCWFPLRLGEDQALGDLFLHAKACSHSWRYGCVGDNVLGLDWRLPNGLRVGLGGRTVKNVAGFDLVRFLNNSKGRFGEPENLVLRLRPLPQAEHVLEATGSWTSLQALARALRLSAWSHALDACDLLATQENPCIFIAFSGRPDLLDLFTQAMRDLAQAQGCSLKETASLPQALSQPWARVQAPLEDMLPLAEDWLKVHGGRAHGFLGQGLLQLEGPSDGSAGEADLRGLHGRLASAGGHVEQPDLKPDPGTAQAHWEADLLKRLEALA